VQVVVGKEIRFSSCVVMKRSGVFILRVSL
jgi:hypothetical protein